MSPAGFAKTDSQNESLFWELARPILANPGVSRSTMMGLPCLRYEGRFFASFDRRAGAMLAKLSQQRVLELVESRVGEKFSPAGRTFREWVALPSPDRRRWRSVLREAERFARRDQGPTLARTSSRQGKR